MHRVILLFLLVMTGCAQSPKPHDRPDLTCAPYTNTQEIVKLKATHTIILGEIHGTVQGIATAQALACAMLHDRQPLLIGIEAASDRSMPLNFAVKAMPSDRQLLLAAPNLWSSRDGRGSISMFQFLKDISTWNHQGYDVSVFAFDVDASSDNESRTRDEIMAQNIDRHISSFKGGVLLITGNLHAAKVPLDMGEETFVPMASLLTSRPTLSFEMKHQGGAAWVITSQENQNGEIVYVGEPTQLPPNTHNHRDQNRFQLDDTLSETYDGLYYTGAITASPPTQHTD